MKKYIKDTDMFGHTINLNFNKNGDSHKTFIGGLFSILIKMLLGLYVYLLFKRMFLYEADSNYTRINVLDLEKFGKQMLNKTDMTIFHVFKKKLPGAKTPFIDDEFETYLHVKFTQINNNYVDRGPNNYAKDILTVRGKNCENKDLSGTPELNQKILDTWKGFSLICPDFKEGDGFYLKGNAASTISDMVRMDIVRCDDEYQKKNNK